MKTSVFGSLILASFVSLAGFANDPPTTDNHDSHHAAWVKYATPGEGQKRLEDMAGKFKFTMKWWAAPEAKAEESTGTSTNKWIMGRRFIQSEVKGTAMGKPFEGMGLTAFDNLKEEYQSVWLDNMATGMMWSNGTFANGTIAQTGTMTDATTGDKARWFRSEWKILNKKEHTYTTFMKTPDGKEFKSMEINYKRS